MLILDEPASALGVHQASTVLRYVARARERGLGVVFITHNIHHPYPVGDVFTLLDRGRSLGTFGKEDVSGNEVLEAMAGRRELARLHDEIGRPAPTGAAAVSA